MRYWRYYPKFLQVILLMLMIFTLFSFTGVIIGACIQPLFGVSVQDVLGLNMKSGPKVIAAFQFLRGVSSIFQFMLCALLFAYLTHPKPFDYLGIRKPKKGVHFIIILVLLCAFVPLSSQLASWLQHFDFGANAKADFSSNQEKMEAFMQGTSVQDLLLYLLISAVLPAIGEEFFFRGVIMRFSYNNSYNIHMAVLFSAAIFGLAHGSAYNFLPIMLAGVLLGYIYYFTGSIWPGVFAHFLNNAIAILFLFLGNKGIISKSTGNIDVLPWYIVIASTLIFILAFLWLRKKATPLPKDWNDDFREERQLTT